MTLTVFMSLHWSGHNWCHCGFCGCADFSHFISVYLHPATRWWELGGPGSRSANLRTVARCEQHSPGDGGPHHLLTENVIVSRATAQTQAVMKAVRKCVPVPVILLFVNILFIRNYSEKEKGAKQTNTLLNNFHLNYFVQFLVRVCLQLKTLRW